MATGPTYLEHVTIPSLRQDITGESSPTTKAPRNATTSSNTAWILDDPRASRQRAITSLGWTIGTVQEIFKLINRGIAHDYIENLKVQKPKLLAV